MSSFSRWTKRLFGNPVSRPRAAARPNRSRLDMESLEAREVPATLTWTGAGDFFTTPNNWSPAGPPANGDTVVFSQTPDTVINQNINGLSLAEIRFTNGGNVLTIQQPTNLGGAASNLTNTTGNNSITGGTITFTGTIDATVGTGGNLTIDSTLAGNQAFRVTGPGMVTLAGAGNTFSGAVTVFSGTLQLNTNSNNAGLGASTSVTVGDSTGTADAALILASSEEVTNNATVTVRSDGILFLGTGVAETVGTLNLNNGSTFVFADISGATDVINATTVNLTTGAMLVASTVGMSFGNGQVLTLINNTGNAAVGGTFANMPEGSNVVVNGLNFTISYVGGTGNDVTLTYKAPTPPAMPKPFYSGATTIPGPNGTSTLVVTGAGVAGGQTTLQLPAGSAAFFTDISGDGIGDIVLIVPAGVFVFNGQTGAFFIAFFDSNGDGVKELIRF